MIPLQGHAFGINFGQWWFLQTSLEVNIDDIYRPGSVLDMPQRPFWDYNMKKEKLLAQEEKYFRVCSTWVLSNYVYSWLFVTYFFCAQLLIIVHVKCYRPCLGWEHAKSHYLKKLNGFFDKLLVKLCLAWNSSTCIRCLTRSYVKIW